MASGGDFESSDPVEAAGLSILRLLQKAADAADQNRIQALDTAQKLAQELRAAQDRIAQLEGDVAANRDHAERAELWLSETRGGQHGQTHDKKSAGKKVEDIVQSNQKAGQGGSGCREAFDRQRTNRRIKACRSKVT
jgi:hypothetical protein